MAVGVHVVRVAVLPVNSVGQVIDKNSELNVAGGPASIGEMTDFENQHRILEDSLIASSIGYPSVKDYLEAEAIINFVLHYMDQNMIVTYEHDSGTLP